MKIKHTYYFICIDIGFLIVCLKVSAFVIYINCISIKFKCSIKNVLFGVKYFFMIINYIFNIGNYVNYFHLCL